MSFDLSRMPYAHPRCGDWPCTCARVHQPLAMLEIPCWDMSCPATFQVMTEVSEHHLLCHERAYE